MQNKAGTGNFNPFDNYLLMYSARQYFFHSWAASHIYTHGNIATIKRIFSSAPGESRRQYLSAPGSSSPDHKLATKLKHSLCLQSLSQQRPRISRSRGCQSFSSWMPLLEQTIIGLGSQRGSGSLMPPRADPLIF